MRSPTLHPSGSRRGALFCALATSAWMQRLPGRLPGVPAAGLWSRLNVPLTGGFVWRGYGESNSGHQFGKLSQGFPGARAGVGIRLFPGVLGLRVSAGVRG
jgi:hypothetical protein